eukprot:TRINITY_DN47928_c0_g1_i1.p1 TRINITY_DN47928_c0_g1~~TRINITY_DN47928_c0_g1_i1.p1  ORF type:complete len:507 (+),score=107.96 TRINITY_DN47928_c0_g1_i1:124-1644(+)
MRCPVTVFGRSNAIAWLLLSLLIAPVTGSRLSNVQTSGDDNLQADIDVFESLNGSGEDFNVPEDLPEEELDNMSPKQKAILSIQSSLGMIAAAAVEAETAAAPVVLQAVGKFGKFAFHKTVHLTSGLLEAASMCKQENRELVSSAVSQVQSFARMMAAAVAELWPQVRSGLTSFAEASSTQIEHLGRMLGPVVDTTILTPAMQNVKAEFEKLRDSAFEEHPNVEKVSQALVQISKDVAALSAAVANHTNQFVHREDVQHYFEYIQDSAGQIASVALEKTEQGLAAFAEFAKNKIQDLSGQALNAMCDPEVRKHVRDAISVVIANVRKLASAIKDKSSVVKHFVEELAKAAHTEIVILVSQISKEVPSPTRDALLKQLEAMRIQAQKMINSPREVQTHARNLLVSARNLLLHVPRPPGFGQNVPFEEAAADEDCRWTNFLLRPVNMKGQGRTVEETIDACQQRCASVEGCEFYSYWPDGGCHLQSGEARDRLRHAQHVIAGTRVCEK